MNSLFHYLDQANAWFWSRVANSTRVDWRSLCLYRWVFGLFLLAFAAPSFAWIDQAPRAFFNPPPLSVPSLFAGFPSPPFFLVLNVACVVSLCSLTMGMATRTSTILYIVCNLLGTSFAYSFGKIDHTILRETVLIAMCFSDWGAHYSVDARRAVVNLTDAQRQRMASRALSLLAVLIAFGMFSAGAEKSLVWVDFNTDTSGFLSWFYSGFGSLNRTYLLASYVPWAPYWVFELLDYSAVLFELSGFVVLLLSRRWWLAWLFVACLFHIGNVLLLNIPFILHVGIYLAFVDWHRLVQTWLPDSMKRQSSIWQIVGTGVVVFLAAWQIANLLNDLPWTLLPSDGDSRLYALLLVAIVLWILAAIVLLQEWIASKKKQGSTPCQERLTR